MEPDGLAVGVDSLGVAAEVRVRDPEGVPRVGIVRVEPDGLAEGVDGLGVAGACDVRDAEVVPGDGLAAG